MSEELDRVKAALSAAEEVVTQEEAQEEARGERREAGGDGESAGPAPVAAALVTGDGAAQVLSPLASRPSPIALGEGVHYRLREGRNLGDLRPAMVVRVWDAAAGLVNLAVFADFWNDGLNCPSWATSVHEGDAPGEYRRVV